jgi:hypothetical protein
VLLNKAKRLADFPAGQSRVLGDLDRRFKPDLCLAVLTLDVDKK